MYKWIEINEQVRRLSDGACIPNDAGNADWQAFQKWISAGGVCEAADAKPAPIDYSNADNIEKSMKAILLAAANMAGKTPAQAKAAFKEAWDALG